MKECLVLLNNVFLENVFHTNIPQQTRTVEMSESLSESVVGFLGRQLDTTGY